MKMVKRLFSFFNPPPPPSFYIFTARLGLLLQFAIYRVYIVVNAHGVN